MRHKTVKVSILLIVLTVMLSTVSGCSNAFFRKVEFGMTYEEVVAAESDLGEPQSVLEESGIKYKEIVQYNMGGDLIYLFDEEDQLAMIMFYAYPDYYQNEAVSAFLLELITEYPGYLSEDEEEPLTVQGEFIEQWVVTDTNITVHVYYEENLYFLLTFEQSVSPNTDESEE